MANRTLVNGNPYLTNNTVAGAHGQPATGAGGHGRAVRVTRRGLCAPSKGATGPAGPAKPARGAAPGVSGALGPPKHPFRAPLGVPLASQTYSSAACYRRDIRPSGQADRAAKAGKAVGKRLKTVQTIATRTALQPTKNKRHAERLTTVFISINGFSQRGFAFALRSSQLRFGCQYQVSGLLNT